MAAADPSLPSPMSSRPASVTSSGTPRRQAGLPRCLSPLGSSPPRASAHPRHASAGRRAARQAAQQTLVARGRPAPGRRRPGRARPRLGPRHGRDAGRGRRGERSPAASEPSGSADPLEPPTAAGRSPRSRRCLARGHRGSVSACDPPQRPGDHDTHRLPGHAPGSWARPSNRSQATRGCDRSASAPRSDQQVVDRCRGPMATTAKTGSGPGPHGWRGVGRVAAFEPAPTQTRTIRWGGFRAR
jgi:hypothetical protein